jgi:hypothetical protein
MDTDREPQPQPRTHAAVEHGAREPHNAGDTMEKPRARRGSEYGPKSPTLVLFAIFAIVSNVL